MKTGLKKSQKTTEIFFDEASRWITVNTYNTDLKNRLAAYAKKHPNLCRLTDDTEDGGLSFEVAKTYLETETDKTESLQRFIDKVKRITEIKEPTSELVHEFIDKIVVHAPRYLDGKRVQLIDIYYNGVGILRELTPEEMEEAFQNHMAERKTKTA